MTKLAAALLLLGALIVVAGVALFSIRCAVVLAGLLVLAAGVLSLERGPADTEEPRR